MIPYTPKALQMIREGARPAELGWSQSMYETICKRHGLNACTPILAAPAVRPAETPPAPPTQHSGGVGFDHAHARVSRGMGCVIIKSTRQLDVFAFFYGRYVAGDHDFMSAKIALPLMSRPDLTDISQLVDTLNRVLLPLRCAIEHKRGAGNGYRFVVEP